MTRPPARRSLAASLVLPLSLLACLRTADASSSSTTCAPSSNGTTISWWNTHTGDSPCVQFEKLYQQCDSSFRMFDISSSVNYVCEPDQNPSDFCCCSSASYTLFQACRSCQAGALPTANSTSPDQTYSDYLHSCPTGITTNASLASNLSSSGLASWAFRPIPASGTWDYAGAQANATKEGRWRAAGASTGLSSGAKAGVAVAVILVLAIGAVLFYKHVVPRIRRRRARARGDEDFEVTDAGYKSWYGGPSTPGGASGWRGSVAGYFAGASLAGGSASGGKKGGAGGQAGAWNEMKDDGGPRQHADVYPLSGAAAPFGQSANPFVDPNHAASSAELRHHDDQQQRDQHADADEDDDVYGAGGRQGRHADEPYPEDAYDQYQIGEDDDAGRPPLDNAADGWQEREGESDWDRQRRWEDEGRAGGGGGGGAGHHARDQSFGGGGEHGDGMYPVAI